MSNNKNEKEEEIKTQSKENLKQKSSQQQEEQTTKQKNNEEEKTKMHSKAECVPNEEYIKLKYQFAEFINKHKEYETEFENYKRRTREEIKQAKEDGITKAVETLLPALDSFKKAKKIISDKASISGINLIEKSILQELEKLGVKRIKCVGEPFNADIHNAVALVEDENAKSGTVVEELEAGYTMGEKIIKFSQVIVAK